MRLTSTLSSGPSAASGTIDMPEDKDRGGTETGFRGRHQRWLGGQVATGARAAVWTEPGAGAQAGTSSKVSTETGIMAGTDIWAEVGADRRPGDTGPTMSRDPAAWLEQRGLRAQGGSRGEEPDVSSVSSILAETVAPILAKPLALLSKAVWSRSFSSSLSKSSAPTTKASSLPPSSSSSPASNGETQTAAASSTSVSNSSASNSSTHWGKMLGPVLEPASIQSPRSPSLDPQSLHPRLHHEQTSNLHHPAKPMSFYHTGRLWSLLYKQK